MHLPRPGPHRLGRRSLTAELLHHQRGHEPLKAHLSRRAAVEPVIGHLKAEHRMGRNHLKGYDGDRINAVLAATGYNFSLLLRWLAQLLRALLQIFATTPNFQPLNAKTLSLT